MVFAMSAKEPKSIKSVLLEQNSALASLSERAAQSQSLLGQVQHSLPHAMRDSIYAANLEDSQLTLVCASAQWATRLRFYSETLMQDFAADHKIRIKTIRLKVRPPR